MNTFWLSLQNSSNLDNRLVIQALDQASPLAEIQWWYEALWRLCSMDGGLIMLRPAMSEILKKDESCYAFVIEVAKRAREIALEAEENHVVLEEKPVKLAVDEFARSSRMQTKNTNL